jgi:hypothetical protein
MVEKEQTPFRFTITSLPVTIIEAFLVIKVVSSDLRAPSEKDIFKPADSSFSRAR